MNVFAGSFWKCRNELGIESVATAMMLKDLKLAQDAAAKSGASTPLGAQAEALYALFDGIGHGGRDFSAMLQMLRGKLDELNPA